MNAPSTPEPTTFDQFLATLEEWSSREQLAECVSTLRRFHAARNTVEQAVKWLQFRESVLKEEGDNAETRSDSPTLDYDEYDNRGEGFGA